MKSNQMKDSNKCTYNVNVPFLGRLADRHSMKTVAL
jgi:hypothetical protein